MLQVKCGACGAAAGHPVYHHWYLELVPDDGTVAEVTSPAYGIPWHRVDED